VLECAVWADAGTTHVALGAIPIVAAITIASRFVNINMFTCSAVKSFTWLCVMKTFPEIATLRFMLLDRWLSWCGLLVGALWMQ
jgi:hypothetical protein